MQSVRQDQVRQTPSEETPSLERLADIKRDNETRRAVMSKVQLWDQIDWLIVEVERLRFELAHEETMRERDLKDVLANKEIRP